MIEGSWFVRYFSNDIARRSWLDRTDCIADKNACVFTCLVILTCTDIRPHIAEFARDSLAVQSKVFGDLGNELSLGSEDRGPVFDGLHVFRYVLAQRNCFSDSIDDLRGLGESKTFFTFL